MVDLARHRRLVVAGLTLFVIAISGWVEATPAGAAAAPPKLFGMHGDYTWDVESTRITSSLDAEASFGSDITRDTLRWNVTEPTQGTYDWSDSDFVVNEAAKRNLQVLLVVRAAPQWANGSPDPRVVPSDVAAFNTFVTRYKTFFKAAVQRYASKVKYWEIWTEPNETFYWQPSGLTPQTNTTRWIDMYAQLYRDTRTAVRQINTTVQLSVGALTGLGASCCIRGTTFLNALIDRALVFDDLAINPHSSINQAPWNCITNLQSFCDIQKMRDILVNRGRSNTRLWVTEFGWQVGGFTMTGTTTTTLRIPGNQYRLALWPNTGQVQVAGETKNYSSITRTTAYNDIHLTSPLVSAPATNTEVSSPQADSTQAAYVREAIRMLRGKYVPQSGRPPQDYSYTQIAIYFRTRDAKTTTWGMYGLMHEPTPNFDEPLTWTLRPRPAATVFSDETKPK